MQQSVLLALPVSSATATPSLILARAAIYHQTSATVVKLDTSQPYVFYTNGFNIPASYLDHLELTLPNTGFFKTSGPNESTALPGSATSVSIPANTLPPGVDLSAQLVFARGSAIGTAGGFSYFSGSGSVTSATFHTAGTPDTVAPLVSSSSPKNNATGVSLTAPLKITFNEPMRMRGWSITYGGIDFTPPVQWISSTVIKISPPPQGWPANTKISFTLDPAGFTQSIQDLSGNPLATKTVAFTTGN